MDATAQTTYMHAKYIVDIEWMLCTLALGKKLTTPPQNRTGVIVMTMFRNTFVISVPIGDCRGRH